MANTGKTLNKVEYQSLPVGNRQPWNLALALKCMAEVKKLNLISNPCKELLTAICYEFDADMLTVPLNFSFIKNHILPLAKSVGPSWPEKDHLKTILQSREKFRYAYIYDNLFGSFIGYVGQGSAEVHKAVLEYAAHEEESLRVSAPFALATGWRDEPETYKLICEMADNDAHRTVCYAAVYALAEHFNEKPETFELLQRHAINSKHDFGRAAAITGLAEHYSEIPGIYEIILDRSIHESNKFPRTISIKALGEYFNDRSQTFERICDAAINDSSPLPEEPEYADPYYVRDAAIAALFKYWPGDPATTAVLKACSESDPTMWLRRKAWDMLEQLKIRHGDLP